VEATQGEGVFTYVHGEGRIGAALVLATGGTIPWDRPELQELAANLTLHVAAFGPLYLSRAAVDPAYLEQKKAEYLADARTLGKPEGMVTRIAEGKLDKHLCRVCLLEQGYIRDESLSVGAMLSALKQRGGPDVAVKVFAYEKVGT
jgi:elongation factor Ts